MQLTEHRNENELFVRHADAASVRVIDRTFTRSLILTAATVIDDFAPAAVAEIDPAAVDRIVALNPEVVLLGTGARVEFPPPPILAAFLRRGIGLEVMDNAAAARTFNVLAGEGRNAIAVFLLPARAG
jgi:uncharacterized protein